MPAARIIKPGLQTTVQDFGRFGYRHLGVPVSGAIDRWSLRAANLLVGNEPGAAALEISMVGPELTFLRDCIVAVTGGETELRLSRRRVTMWETLYCSAGDTLCFGWRKSGCRNYLAFSGGIDIPPVLGSRSTFLTSQFGGYQGRILRAGDLIGVYPAKHSCLGWRVPEGQRPVYSPDIKVKVITGINAGEFSPGEYAKFFNSRFTVTRRLDRMGCFLEGACVTAKHDTGVMESYPVIAGSIQVLPSGNPVVLLNDAQSTGGYPQIACIASDELWKIGQALPGDSVTFLAAKSVPDMIRKEPEIKLERVPQFCFYQNTGKSCYEIKLYRIPETE